MQTGCESFQLADLFPANVIVAEAYESISPESLSTQEANAIAGATTKRVFEFATGRWCAHTALTKMGIRGFSLLPKADRSPNWPPNIVGSITHTDGYCAAALAHRNEFSGIGIDAEVEGSVGRELWEYLFTTEEFDWLKGLPTSQQLKMATLLFSAKESFYKCQYPITGLWLDFKACTIAVAGEKWTAKVDPPIQALNRMQYPISGKYMFFNRFVVTTLVIYA